MPYFLKINKTCLSLVIKLMFFRVREINTSIEIIIFVEANIIKFNKPLSVIINSVLKVTVKHCQVAVIIYEFISYTA